LTQCQWISGDIELLAGAVGAALECYCVACAFLEQMHHPRYLATLSAELAEAHFVQEEFDDADRWTRISEANSGSDDVSAQFLWRSVRAKLMGRRGEAAAAETLAREALDLACVTDALNWRAKVALDLAEVLRLDGRLEEASAYVSDAVSLFDRKGNVVSAKRAESLREALAIA
jgi:hypothetical protein